MQQTRMSSINMFFKYKCCGGIPLTLAVTTMAATRESATNRVSVMCDSIGSPAPQQEAVMVSAIVHTDSTDFRQVRVPAFAPLFVMKGTDDNPMRSASGIVHVYLGPGRTTVDVKMPDFFGISTDEFVADFSKGDACNHISCAIAGAVSCATPNSIFIRNAQRTNPTSDVVKLGQPVGYNEKQQYADTMEYNSSVCHAVCTVPANISGNAAGTLKSIGTFLGYLDYVESDGIRILLRSKTLLAAPPQTAVVDTAAELDPEFESSSAAVETEPVSSARAQPPQSAAQLSVSDSMFVDPANDDMDEFAVGSENVGSVDPTSGDMDESAAELEKVGQKRPSKSGSKKDKRGTKKERR